MFLVYLWRRPHKAHLVPERVSHPNRGGRGHAGNLRLSIQTYTLGSALVFPDISEGQPRLTLPLEHT